jgi:hypothetical protein
LLHAAILDAAEALKAYETVKLINARQHDT